MGRLIRHAGSRLAPPVLLPPAAMIQPSALASLIPAVGAAAVALAAVTMPADPEHCLAFAAKANPLTENRFAMNSHARPWAALDNGNRSWRARISFDEWWPVLGCPAGTLPVATAGSHIRSRFRTQIYTLGEPF